MQPQSLRPDGPLIKASEPVVIAPAHWIDWHIVALSMPGLMTGLFVHAQLALLSGHSATDDLAQVLMTGVPPAVQARIPPMPLEVVVSGAG